MLLRLASVGTVLVCLCTAAAGRPVVVELFTSEGCPSCPPADAVLTDLARGRAGVLPLAFHVTHCDRLGWRDPYGLGAATSRQGRYGSRFGDGSYTPEMVVDGTKGFVGAERNTALDRAGALLETALSSLPPRQREAVEALALRQMSLDEAATGVNEGALKVSLHRALKSLRERFGGAG